MINHSVRSFTLAFLAGIAAGSPIQEPDGSNFPPFNDKAVVKEKVKAVAPTKALQTTPDNPARQPEGALTGKIVYAGAGHGWVSNGSSWLLQRPLLSPGIIEDLGNIDQVRIFADYALRAGATVVTFRPVGRQINEVVLDNDDPGVTFIPEDAWLPSSQTEYFGDPGDTAYRYAATSTEETAVARYTPAIPEEGFYPVYCWARDGSDRVNQLYRIRHSGGFTEITVNHRMVGKGWVYLGNYHFEAGTEGYVEISNRANEPGVQNPVVIADAIRFGNGMGDVVTGSGISGYSREDEGSVYWIQRMAGQGASSIIWERNGPDDQSDNVSAPTYMSGWMNREQEGDIYDRIYLGFHTNAYDPGSLGLHNEIHGTGPSTPNQREWAEIIARELNNDMVAIGSPPLENPWPDRIAQGRSLVLANSSFAYGEIRGDRNNQEMDATIIEVAAHGNVNEAEVLQDLKARRWVARASVQAIIKYMEQFDQDGGDLTMPPDIPLNVRSERATSQTVTISWDAPPSGEIEGDPAASYVLYRSPNGYGYSDPIHTENLSVTIPWPQETEYYRIAARNSGGESPWTEVLAVRKSRERLSEFLIVNGFDRIDRFQNVPDEGQPGALRIRERQINSQDYSVQHGEAISAAERFGFVTSSNEAVISGAVSLTSYPIVFWVVGEESTNDETLNAAERQLLRNYLAAGGKLFISGAELGWHLDQGGADPEFYHEVLRANYEADTASTRAFTGMGAFAGISGSFPLSDQIYDSEFPDVISPLNGSVAVLNYTAQQIAGIAFEDRGEKLIYLGFPFEVIAAESTRAQLMDTALEFFIDPPELWMMY